MRLDAYLLHQGLAKDEREATGLIMAGRVLVDGQRRDKPGFAVAPGVAIAIRPGKEYVSRGGYKLERAITAFPIELSGKVCLDVGSSTGGFTDCMLKHGAARVYAIDVGYGLLDWTLRNDPRVVVKERINARALTPEMLGEMGAFASVDVSFISLQKILPALRTCLRQGAYVVALVKPQFEALRAQVGKGGVVREAHVRGEVIKKARNYALQSGFAPLKCTPSPIAGADGNIEFLLWMRAQ